MTETERLIDRLYGTGGKIKNIKFDIDHATSTEQIAKMVNSALDEIEAGNATLVENID